MKVQWDKHSESLPKKVGEVSCLGIIGGISKWSVLMLTQNLCSKIAGGSSSLIFSSPCHLFMQLSRYGVGLQ